MAARRAGGGEPRPEGPLETAGPVCWASQQPAWPLRLCPGHSRLKPRTPAWLSKGEPQPVASRTCLEGLADLDRAQDPGTGCPKPPGPSRGEPSFGTQLLPEPRAGAWRMQLPLLGPAELPESELAETPARELLEGARVCVRGGSQMSFL